MNKTHFFGCAVMVFLVIGIFAFTGCPDDDPNTDQTFTVSGTITNESDSPIAGASVQLKEGAVNRGSPVTTNTNGAYTIRDVSSGTYTIAVSANGFDPGQSSTFNVNADLTGINLTLNAATYTVSGTITDELDDSPIAGSSVQLKEGTVNRGSPVTTNSNGEYTILNVSNGTYTIAVSMEGYHAGESNTFTVANANQTGIDLSLIEENVEVFTLTVVNGIASSTTFAADTVVSITANTLGGEHFIAWISEDGIVFTDETAVTTTFTMPADDVTITARVLFPLYTGNILCSALWSTYQHLHHGLHYFRDDGGLLALGAPFDERWTWMSEHEPDLIMISGEVKSNLAIRNNLTGNFINVKGITPTSIEDAENAQQIKVSPFEDDPAFYWGHATPYYDPAVHLNHLNNMTLFSGPHTDDGHYNSLDGFGIMSVLGNFDDDTMQPSGNTDTLFAVLFLDDDFASSWYSARHSGAYAHKGPHFHALFNIDP